MRLDREGWVTRQHADNNRHDLVSYVRRRGINQLRRNRAHMAKTLQPMAKSFNSNEEQLLFRLETNMMRLLRQVSDKSDTQMSD